MWALFAGESKESPGSNGFAEYNATPSYVNIPILTTFRGEWGEYYTVVVGVHHYCQGCGANGFITPTLAYYSGNGHGSARLTRLTDKFGEVSRGGEWRTVDDADWSLFKTNFEEHLRQHLHITSQ